MGANGSSSNSGAVEENDDDLPPLEDESESETTAPSTNNPIMDQIRYLNIFSSQFILIFFCFNIEIILLFKL